MFGVSRQTLERLRKEYPSGTRVELIRLDDPYRKIPSGTIGTVEFVDDAGQLHTVWEGHGSLAMIYGVDEWRKIQSTYTPFFRPMFVQCMADI